MGRFLGITVNRFARVGVWRAQPMTCLWHWEPDRRSNVFSPPVMCRHIYNWNTVWCDVKQRIWGEVNWLLSVTINDISVIDVQADWRRKLDLRSDSQRHRHYVRSFNVTIQHRHGPPFRKTAPFSRLLRHAGDTEGIFSTYSPGSLWGINQSHSLTRMTIWREKERNLTQKDNAYSQSNIIN